MIPATHVRLGSQRERCIPLRCIAVGKPPFEAGRQSTCTMQFGVISQVAWLRIGVHVDYFIVHGPESMPPAYAAREIGSLAPDHSGGSASDEPLGPRKGCRT